MLYFSYIHLFYVLFMDTVVGTYNITALHSVSKIAYIRSFNCKMVSLCSFGQSKLFTLDFVIAISGI